MGVEPPPALRRVAGQTIPLGMAGHAAFQILPRGLAMVQGEVLLRIVIAAVQRALSAETGVHMALGAELAGIMTVAAIRLSRVGRCRVPGEKSGGMIPGSGISRIGPVAVKTLGPHVAALASLRSGVRYRPMSLGEVASMRGRSLALSGGTLGSSRPGHRKDLYRRGLAEVTGETALLGMAGRAGG